MNRIKAMSAIEGCKGKAKKIALLGATSHIAKGLICNFLKHTNDSLDLFSRSPDQVKAFLESFEEMDGIRARVRPHYSEFGDQRYDAVINCVGVGTQNHPGADYTAWFTVTEQFDNLAIDYLRRRNPEALYFSLSSGIVYGLECVSAAGRDSLNRLQVNELASKDYYMIARLNAEAKHRAFGRFRIVDLRIFNYFSRYINLGDGYFITDILNRILADEILLTDEMNIVRDYVHPDDLFSLMTKAMVPVHLNTALDVISAKPATKTEILDLFSREYGLRYQIQKSSGSASGTGTKRVYYSEYNKAADLGFLPKFSTVETLRREAAYILRNH
jgi:nucleoside-diphosphate-sugar epimerase